MRQKTKTFLMALTMCFALFACATAKQGSKTGEIDEKAPIIHDGVVEKSDIATPSDASGGAAEGAAPEWSADLKICLVLGPGMARGFAHAGILEAVAEAGLKPFCIVGTEMGALVGAIYAQNLNTNSLQWQLFKLKKETYLDFPMFTLKDKTASGEKLYRFLHDVFGDRRFNDLKIPYAISLTEAGSGDTTLLRDGTLADTIGAAMALPGVFRSKEIPSKGSFMSGSASSPLPVKEAFEMGATHVIAVDLLTDNFGISPAGGVEAEIGKQFVAARNLAKFQRPAANFLITPDLRRFTFTDFEKRVEIISVSKRAAVEQLAKIRAAIHAPAKAEEKK